METENKTEQAETTVDSSVGSKVTPKLPRPKLKLSDKNKSSAAVEPWEVASSQPYPYFLQWRALHYKNQGGHWANSPLTNAYAEFYKNRFKTNILWQEFLQFYNLALDNALALQAAEIEVRLPSCFSDRVGVSESEVVQTAQILEQNSASAKSVIPPATDFSAKISRLVRQHTMPKPKQELPQPKDPVKQYLDWLGGDEPVLVEEARKKLRRMVMERSDLYQFQERA